LIFTKTTIILENNSYFLMAAKNELNSHMPKTCVKAKNRCFDFKKMDLFIRDVIIFRLKMEV